MAAPHPTPAGTFGQNSYAIYGDLEADIVKRLSVGLAGRYEHYNNFGGDFVYKANALYKYSDDFSLRGTIGTASTRRRPASRTTRS